MVFIILQSQHCIYTDIYWEFAGDFRSFVIPAEEKALTVLVFNVGPVNVASQNQAVFTTFFALILMMNQLQVLF